MGNKMQELERFNKIVLEIAREFGLDPFEVDFVVIPNEQMLEVMAYHLPGNYGHWSHGRDYEIERTRYDHGFGLPYEVVLNTDPATAFLMEGNPTVLQVMVIAHVYGHSDIFKNNAFFAGTRRDMLAQATAARIRFGQYESEFGLKIVEKTIDAAKAIEMLIGFSLFRKERDAAVSDKNKKIVREPKIIQPFDILHPQDAEEPEKNDEEEIVEKVKPSISEDVVSFILQHSRKLRDWQRDILATMRGQEDYLWPQIETKILNEGWAAYWHERIMHELFRRGILDDKAHGVFNRYHSAVLASSRLSLNPYLVGSFLFRSIKDRWDRGAFGSEWEQLGPRARKAWDKKLGGGTEKLFEVRRIYNDTMLLAEFLTSELVDELDLYIYQENHDPQTGEVNYEIVERDWRKVRDIIVRSRCFMPVIVVKEDEFKKRGHLYLEHVFDGIPLDEEYAIKTLQHIAYLWGDTVYLLTYEREGKEKKKAEFLEDLFEALWASKQPSKFKKILWVAKEGSVVKKNV